MNDTFIVTFISIDEAWVPLFLPEAKHQWNPADSTTVAVPCKCRKSIIIIFCAADGVALLYTLHS
jgi:hypothetical protein